MLLICFVKFTSGNHPGPGRLCCCCCEVLATASISLVIICLQTCFWMGVSPTKSLGILDCPWLCLKGLGPNRALSGSLRLRHGCLLSGPCAEENCLWTVAERDWNHFRIFRATDGSVSNSSWTSRTTCVWTAAMARFEISIRLFRIIRDTAWRVFCLLLNPGRHLCELCLGGWFISKVGEEPTKGGKLCFETSCKSLYLPSNSWIEYMCLLEDHKETAEDWDRPPEIYLSLSNFCEWQIEV